MRDTRLIFVDGIPTTGKSTTAHNITLQMQRAGIDAAWYYEEEPGGLHPVHVYEDMASTGFIQKSLARYRAFAAEAEKTERTTVLDGSLFMNSVQMMFSRDDIDPDAMKDYVRRVLAATRRLDPTLIYLYRRSVPRALDDMAERRSPEWRDWFINWWTGRKPYVRNRGWEGIRGAAGFWSAYQSFTDELFSESDISKLAVETSGAAWTARIRRILDFLEVPYSEEEAASEDYLRKYVGTYEDPEGRRRARHGVPEISVWLERGDLFLGGLKWPRMRLIPKSPGHFLVEGITIELAFQEGANGEVLGFTVCGRQVDGMLGEALIKR